MHSHCPFILPESVSSASKSTVEDYKRVVSGHIGSVVGSRIVELIQELPVLARSGRDMELRAKIKLVTGYLLLDVDGFLRSSLMSVADEIRASLAGKAVCIIGAVVILFDSSHDVALKGLFDVDFDSIQYAPTMTTAMDQSLNVWKPEQRRFRFMNDETSKSARHMVQAMGKALGVKGASMFVDACVADVLEASIAASHSFFGVHQVGWLHQWIGFIVVAQEVSVFDLIYDVFVSGLREASPIWNIDLVLDYCWSFW